jgi:hypothetical protein
VETVERAEFEAKAQELETLAAQAQKRAAEWQAEAEQRADHR